MLLDESKSRSFLRPWWDVVFGHGLILQIGICAALLAFFSGAADKKVVLEEQSVITSSLAGNNDTSSSTSLESPIDDDGASGDADFVDLSGINGTIANILRKVSAAASSAVDLGGESQINSKIIKTDLSMAGPMGSQLVMFALVASCFLWLQEAAFARIFYNHLVVQALLNLLKRDDDGSKRFTMANVLHHSSDKRSLRRLFDAHNGVRILVVLVLFILVFHSQVSYNGMQGDNQSTCK